MKRKQHLVWASVLCLSLLFLNIKVALALPANSTQSIATESKDEHIVWEKAPIDITLPVGQERFVSFPLHVQLGYNAHRLPKTTLRVQNDHRTLYLLAKKPFKTQRAEAKLENGEVILLNLRAKENADTLPIAIVLPQKTPLQKTQNTKSNAVNSKSVTYVMLMRHAIQALYAPNRLLKQPRTITRFPMNTGHVAALFYDQSAVAMPLASWRGGDLYVTALLIKNRLNQILLLDPRTLCGEFKAASFYPKTSLEPHGTAFDGDATTLFVISTRPFAQAIQVCAN